MTNELPPGPWTVRSFPAAHMIIDAAGDVIGHATAFAPDPEALARLFAAAPALAEALRSITDWLARFADEGCEGSCGDVGCQTYHIAYAALALLEPQGVTQ